MISFSLLQPGKVPDRLRNPHVKDPNGWAGRITACSPPRQDSSQSCPCPSDEPPVQVSCCWASINLLGPDVFFILQLTLKQQVPGNTTDPAFFQSFIQQISCESPVFLWRIQSSVRLCPYPQEFVIYILLNLPSFPADTAFDSHVGIFFLCFYFFLLFDRQRLRKRKREMGRQTLSFTGTLPK